MVYQFLREVLLQAGNIVPSAAQPNNPLERLAQRIARNREVLGLHYPSDSVAGRQLAEQTFAMAIGVTTAFLPSALTDARRPSCRNRNRSDS